MSSFSLNNFALAGRLAIIIFVLFLASNVFVLIIILEAVVDAKVETAERMSVEDAEAARPVRIKAVMALEAVVALKAVVDAP